MRFLATRIVKQVITRAQKSSPGVISNFIEGGNTFRISLTFQQYGMVSLVTEPHTAKLGTSIQLHLQECRIPLPALVRGISSSPTSLASQKNENQDASRSRGLTRQDDEDPFDTITDRIPEKPVTVAEAGSYSLVILAGLAIAGAAVYAVVKELLLEPKEYQVFNRALDRVKSDSRIAARIGSPITGYGQESRNRATRQRISHRVWKDEDAIERIQVQFHVRGPHGAGLVHSEMFKDPDDRGRLKFTYLVVDITSPSQTRIMLESYVPQVPLG